MASKNPKVKVIVIDILKPHQPTIVELGQKLCKCKSIKNVNITVYAIDEKTESVKATIEGDDIKLKEIYRAIDSFGAVVHSVDKAVVGSKKIIEVPKIHEQKTERR